MEIEYSDERKPSMDEVLALYRSVRWSSADKPTALHQGLLASHSLVTAWRHELLVASGTRFPTAILSPTSLTSWSTPSTRVEE